MEISVVNDLASFKAQSSPGSGSGALSNSLKQLSAGQRVNSAADDPSDLAVSERFRNRLRGLVRAAFNALDGAVQKAPGDRAHAGGRVNRMDHTLNDLAVMEENQMAAESTIRDLNMALADYSGRGKEAREKPDLRD